jgi:hypothetical protein
VVGVRHLDLDRAEGNDLAPPDAHDPFEAEAGDEPLGAARHDDRRAGREPGERARVQVVPVHVRDGDDVGTRLELRHRLEAPEVRDAAGQQRIGDDARAVELDHDGAVPQPGDGRRRRHALARRLVHAPIVRSAERAPVTHGG